MKQYVLFLSCLLFNILFAKTLESNQILESDEPLKSTESLTIQSLTQELGQNPLQNKNLHHNNLKNENLRFIYDYDFDFFADNMEDSWQYFPTRTLFATKISPQIGANFYNQNIRLGSYFIINMGEKLLKTDDLKLGLTLYYDFKHNNFRGYFGIFPRKSWLLSYSRFFYRDDFLFFTPIINGFLIQYDNENLKGELMLDWYGGNISKRIDEFMAQLSFRAGAFTPLTNSPSKVKVKNFLFSGFAIQLFHTKNSEILNPNSKNLDVFLLDRFYYDVYFGADFRAFLSFMDEFEGKISWLGGVDRKRFESRGAESFKVANGGELGLKAVFKGFGLDNSLYFGDSQYRYFKEYGENLYWGLPFYQATFYNRAELFYEVKTPYLRARLSFIGHITDIAFAHTQMLSISIDTQKLLGF